MTIEKGYKTACRFHKLVFHRRDSKLECFNRETHNFEQWQSYLKYTLKSF